MDQALTAAADCGRQYEAAPPRIRRQINQGFFRRLLVGPGGTIESAELTEPFAALLADGWVLRAAETAAQASQMDGDAPTSETADEIIDGRRRPSEVFAVTYEQDGITETAQSISLGGGFE